MQRKTALKKFDSIVKGFTKRDRIALIHDLDADGVSSGAITFNAVKLLRGNAPDLVITQPFKTVELLPQTLKTLRQQKISKIIIVDFAADQYPETLRKAERHVKQVLVIDHHKQYSKSTKKTFILKAQHIARIDPSRYPASKLAFDLFSRLIPLEKFSWVASIGLLGDNQLQQWKKFILAAAKKHKSSVAEFEKVAGIISAVEVLEPRKLGGLLLLIANASGPEKVLKSKFARHSKRLERESEKVLREFMLKKEIFPVQELVWFGFRAKHNIKSAVINSVSNGIYPDKTVIFVQDKGDGFVSFSARRQDFKVKANELLEKAVKGFRNAGAGCHIPAAAGRIMKKDLPEFKKRILKALEKQ